LNLVGFWSSIGGDLLVGLSHRDEAQHCHLAFGQQVIGDVRGNFAGDVAMNAAAAAPVASIQL